MTTTTTHTAFALSNMAGCGCPDAIDSPGAQFLLGVQEMVNDRDERDEDAIHEIADSAPDVYTYTRWQEFVDVAAWNEDLDDLGGSTGDMTQDAGVALYLIASRLAARLFEERFGDES
jgi:hypothetical protein